MINSVRNLVLAILNKNNYGYLSPSDFNLYAKMAQIDIFTSYMSEYNKYINMENARISGEGYANLTKFIKNELDNFSVTNTLTQDSANKYFLPSETTTGDVLYYLNTVLVYSSGSYTGTSEEVDPGRIDEVLVSMHTQPTTTFPMHVVEGDSITMYPTTITGASDVKARYIRMPLDPKWTYIELTGGEPVFDQSQGDYQDFELSNDHYVELATKILQYAGLEIREPQVVQTMNGLEVQSKQMTNGVSN